MESDIMVETLPIVGICSLCTFDGVVESMLLKHNNEAVSYMEMLLQCFTIDMASLDLDDTKLLICNTCIQKLQDSLNFKKKVVVSLKNLEAALRLRKADQQSLQCVKEEPKDELDDGDNDIGDDLANMKQEPLDMSDLDEMEADQQTLQCVKVELKDELDDGDNDIEADQQSLQCVKVEPKDELDDGDNDIALDELILKNDSKLYRTRQTKATNKKKLTYTVKKSVDLNETAKMVELGLFPFKICKNHTFSCTICSKKYASLDELKTHIKDHTLSNIHSGFRKMTTSNHQGYYKSSSKLKCKSCKTDVSNYEELKQHIDTCSRVKSSTLPFKLEKDQLDCPSCQKSFLNFVSLNTHMNEHYPNHACDSCGKAFASKARLRAHMRTHEVGDFPCRYCDAVFNKATKRENHVSKEHKSGIRYTCKRCDISFTSFYARQKHLAEVHNEELKRYKCKDCPQSYITPGQLSSHVRRDHLNERNHKCNKCELAFYTRNCLKKHMIKHDGARIHTCNICMKSYQRKKTLKEHMKIHDNDKRFVCPVCGRAFTQKCTLKGHLKIHERKMDVDDRIPQP